jgi:hypothetical protein
MFGTVLLLAATLATSPTLSVGIAPSVVQGPANSHSSFVIQNESGSTEHVVVQIVEMHPVKNQRGAWVPFEEFSAGTISNPELTIPAHQQRKIVVTINSKDGLAHMLAVMAELKSVNHGQARVNAQVGAVYKITGKPNNYAPVAMPQPVSHGSVPVVPIVVTSVLLGILAALGRYLVLRRRRTA